MARAPRWLFLALLLAPVRPAHALTVGDPVPGRVGRSNAIHVTGATPGAVVRLMFGPAGAEGYAPCPGIQSEVEPLWLSPPVVASAAGEARFEHFVAAQKENTLLGIQAAEPATCTLSPALWVSWPKLVDRSLGLSDAKLWGMSGGHAAGWDVAAAGDVNADGRGDVLVAALGAGVDFWGQGVVYLLLGPVGTGDIPLDAAQARLIGYWIDDYLWSVASAGDVNADGFDDVLTGFAKAGNSDEGVAYLVHGPASGDVRLRNDADAQLLGEAFQDWAGLSVAAAGDADLDGFGDILVGAPGNDYAGASSGATYLVRGPVSGPSGLLGLGLADARMYGASGDAAGYSVTAGDFSGDGLPDVASGATGVNLRAGAVYVQHGPVQGTIDLTHADARLFGHGTDAAGFDVAAGDVDLDGVSDLLVGAHGHDYGKGAAYLARGPWSGEVDLAQADVVFLGEPGYYHAGFSVSVAGDTNGDGWPDVLIGTTDRLTDREVAYLVLGPMRGTLNLGNADLRLVTEQPGDDAGSAVSGAGDVDADGFADLLIGAQAHTADVYQEAGAVYLVLGRSF